VSIYNIIKISADKNFEHRYSRPDNGRICSIKLFIWSFQSTCSICYL